MLGRGRGLGSVLRALRALDAQLTVIVCAGEPISAGRLARSEADELSAAELARSLQALTDEQGALARLLRRPLSVDRLGSRPLGNLVIQSLATALGDLGSASVWLGEQLGSAGSVLPATIAPVRYAIDAPRRAGADGETTWAGTGARIRFIPERPPVWSGVLDAIGRARLVLLAPGSLFDSVLVGAAVPAIAERLRSGPARVVWISNLEPAAAETANDQLQVLHRHGLRVDAMLQDLGAGLPMAPRELERLGVAAISRPLRGATPGVHDHGRLRQALDELLGAPLTSTPGVRP